MNKLIASLFLLIIIYGVYNAKFSISKEPKDEKRSSPYQTHTKLHHTTHFEDELSKIDTIEYSKAYIISIIDHGSYDLGFSGGVMEGGFASSEDAPKIACHVIALSGKRCEEPYPNDAEMFYTSICGGCHGNDGKGLNGNYPDLTRAKLLGIERREEFLKRKVAH
ncbi:MAG: hypothetical protein U9R27_09310 [Campylobacterota bacterium]|nr:hypothetical protein [Campylobacterota bacterium]